MTNFPLIIPALRVEQPLGSFYAVVLKAGTLLDVAFTEALNAERAADGHTYLVRGTQRLRYPKRLDEISQYINRTDSAFPGSIILAANFRPDGRVEGETDSEVDEEVEAERKWRIVKGSGDSYSLIIPSGEKLAAVIDGQHRLFAFAKAESARLLDDLLCAVYLDLPRPLQAYLFATINSTQKPVDKSLTYELFGYNLEDEPAERWSPEKLAVFLARRLSSDRASPLKDRVIVAPRNDFSQTSKADWKVSTAVIVQGILRLISTNAKKDSNALLTKPEGIIFKKSKIRSDLREERSDKSPLRSLYLEENDLLLYDIVLSYVVALERVFWEKAPGESFIFKTVGIQALFDILRLVAKPEMTKPEKFEELLRPAAGIDFSEDRFKNASGSGRSIIRREIAGRIGLVV